MTMRTVTLELLRHGPAHNQPLSPLTSYLALCGNHDAETVQVGIEHLQFLRIRESLGYAHGLKQASYGLQDAAREVSNLLESIRSLTAELASSEPVDGRHIHLRLVLSASELALLPFELATSHTGMPGQGQPLSLQTVAPVCLTREVRRVAATTLEWPKKPRILMVIAAPRCVSEVPAREHQHAIEAALSSYLQDITNRDELSRYLTILPEATLKDVSEACSRNTFTHIHILAHGISHPTIGTEINYGLAFHDPDEKDNFDIVSGERLASALRCRKRSGTGMDLSSPAVVSIASCDSANPGGVMAPGASIAHALHEQGIPLVIGSQFPLTIKGSILLTDVFYRRLLLGDDPRSIVHHLRQALYTAAPNSHDWASVVAYAALPSNLDEQLEEARFAQARTALDVMMSQVARVARKVTSPTPSRDQNPALASLTFQEFEGLKRDLMKAMDRFESTAPRNTEGAKQVKAWGMLASARKQVAFLLSADPERGQPKIRPKPGSQLLKDKEFLEVLKKARHDYYKCYQVGAREAWPLVQYLALTAGLQLHEDPSTLRVSKRFRRLWQAATARARENLLWGTSQQKSWARASLAELAVLSLLWATPQQKERRKTEALRQVQRARDIHDMTLYPEAGFDLNSLRRQLLRYVWWGWGSKDMRILCAELALSIEAPDGKKNTNSHTRHPKRNTNRPPKKRAMKSTRTSDDPAATS